MTTLLACMLLTWPGLAGAQPTSPYRTHNFYLVFKLATTLPVTVQDTPECAPEHLLGLPGAEQTAGSGGPSPKPGRLIPYSFVSSLDRASLAELLNIFLREHTFRVADLSPASDREVVHTLTDPGAPGFRYTVHIAERPGGAALCVNVQLPAAPAPFPEPSSPNAVANGVPASRPSPEVS